MSASLKIPRDKFLAKLNERLARADNAAAREEATRVKVDKLRQTAIDKAVKEALKNPSLIISSHVNYNGNVDLTVNAKLDPHAFRIESDPESLSSWERAELENYIKLVEMAESEYIPASLHKNALRFL